MDIVMHHLFKSFGEKQVITDFSLRIKEGTIVSVMAPSGSGKTTLLRILAGLETVDAGWIEGLEDKKISMVFQEDRLCSGLDAVSNIRLVSGKAESEGRIYEELERAGLKGNETYPVKELSGGMRRRVAAVRALMAPYDLLLLDEPFAGLDELSKKRMVDYIREKSAGKTVVMVTHEVQEAEAMEGEVVYLQKGDVCKR